MHIKSLSPVSYSKNFTAQSGQSVSQQSANNNTNSFELPRYNPAFSARIDIESLRQNKDFYDKYFLTDETGTMPVQRMDNKQLSNLCESLLKVDPKLVQTLFTTHNQKTGEVVAHNPKPGVLAAMNSAVSKLDNSSDVFKLIYFARDNKQNMPAHTFTYFDDIETMCDVLDNETIAYIYGSRNKADKNPLEMSKGDGVFAYIADKLDYDKKDLHKVVFNLNKNFNAGSAVLYGPADLEAFMKVYSDDPDTLRNFFISVDKSDRNQKYLNYNVMNNLIDGGYAAESLHLLFKSLVNSNPSLLKDIYTRPDTDGTLLYNNIEIDGTPVIPLVLDTLAKDMINLVSDSDLNAKDSLEVLSKNYEFLSDRTVETNTAKLPEDLPLIREYLLKQVAKQ